MNNEIHRSEGGRVPPQAIEVEESVLGAMLLESEAIDVARPLLNPNDFYKPANRHVYEAIIHLYEEGRQTDLLSVENDLRDNQLLDQVGGPGYLAELTRSASSAANVDYHAQILTEKSLKRRLIIMGTEIAKFCYDSTTDAADALQKAISMLDEVTDRMYTSQGQFVSELMEGVVEDILARRKKKGLTGIGTGYVLDKWTGGWQDGDLYIIAARPSLGKTAMALNASFNSVLYESINAVGFYSNLEMKNYDLIKRRLAVESKVNYLKMRDGKVSDEEVTRILAAADKLTNGRLIVDDATSVNINEWRAKYKTAVRRHGVQFGVVDYLQLMAGNKEGNREQEIASIARGLKDAAKETNTPVIALSQLGRACENRPGAEPYLSDMRESGELENSADGVILLNRPEFFGHKLFREMPTKNKGWVKIAKMRNGMTGEFTMNFNKTYAMWENEYGQYEKFQAEQELDNEERGEKAPKPHSLPDDMDEKFPF